MCVCVYPCVHARQAPLPPAAYPPAPAGGAIIYASSAPAPANPSGPPGPPQFPSAPAPAPPAAGPGPRGPSGPSGPDGLRSSGVWEEAVM